MAEQKADQHGVIDTLLEYVFEEVGLQKGASVHDSEALRFRAALGQHPARLVQQGDLRTVWRVVRQPVRRSAREVHDAALCDLANDTAQHPSLAFEHLWIGDRSRPRPKRVSLLVFGSPLVVVGEHPATKV